MRAPRSSTRRASTLSACRFSRRSCAQPALTTSGGGVVVADFALSVGGEAVVADAADGASVA